MTYDAYVEKMRKIARRIAFVKRHKLAFGALTVAVAAAIIGLLFCCGIFLGEAYSESAVYGDPPRYGASAFLAFPDYRFALTGSDDWSKEYPEKTGSYEMIAQTRNPFGTVRQVGSSFEITKRTAKITLPDTILYYGDSSTKLESRVRASNLAEGDRLDRLVLSVIGELRNSTPVEILSFRIVNSKGTDVTDCYNLTVESGYLTVIKRELTVTAESESKVYDDTPLQNSQWTIESGSLREGDRPDVTVEGSITEPGTTVNRIFAKIYDKNGADVTDIYDLTLQNGTLTVEPRPLTVKTASATKQYDRYPLSSMEYSITGGSLLPGHRMMVDGATSITDVGTVSNVLSFSVQNNMGVDVSSCYQIIQTDGVLKITPIELSFTTGSAEKVYDGTPLVCKQYSQTGGNLLKGDTMEPVFRELTNAGTVENSMICKILDPNGRDVSGNYQITATYGKLTVKRREITLQTDTAEKPYDGTPLFSIGYKLLGGTLADPNTELRALSYAQQTEVGSRVNAVSFGLYLPDGQAVTTNYAITYVNGTLTVTESNYIPPETTPGTTPGTTPDTSPGDLPITLPEDIPPLDQIPGLDGLSGDIPMDSGLPEYLGPLGNLVAKQSGSYYLRMTCFGDYLGGGRWGVPIPYTEMTGLGLNPLDSTTFILRDKYMFDVINGSVTLYTDSQYMLLPELGMTGYPNDCYWPKTVEDNCYDVTFLPQDDLKSILELRDEIYVEDTDYAEYVSTHYLSVPGNVRLVLLDLAKQNGLIGQDEKSQILAVCDYIRGCASYNLAYESYPDGVDPVIYFLTESREGICVHFASAAVLMYRTLGIPARMTGGFLVDAEGGRMATFGALNAHAWVEIYLEGFGWIPVEVTGDGYVTQDDSLIVVPDSGTKTYDGELLTADGYEILSGSLREGDYVIAKVGGSQLFAGKSASKLEIFEIHDSFGRDVTDEYQPIILEGTLEVTPIEIGLNPDEVKLYLGADLPLPDPSELISGDFPEVLQGISPTVRINCPGVRQDSEDPLLIHAFMASKGSISYEYDVDGDGVPEGEAILRIEVRTVTSVTVSEKYGDDALADGDVENAGIFEPLTVTGDDGNEYLAVSLTMGDASKPYDGTPLTCQDFRLLSGALREGDRIVLTSGSYRLYAGIGGNICGSLVVLDENGRDVTRLYCITVYSGRLTVLPSELPLARRTLTVAVDGELELSEVAWSDVVGAFPASYQLKDDGGTVRLKGSRLFGIRTGSAILIMNSASWDLNGDGTPEYDPASYQFQIRVTEKEERPIPVILWVSLGIFTGACVIAAFVLRRRFRKR